MVPHPVPGGGPMNAAVAAARMGAPTAFLGRISTDAHGEMIAAHLEANGINLAAAERGDEPTAKAYVSTEGGLTFRFEAQGTADQCLQTANLAPLGEGPHIVHSGTWGMFRGQTAHTLAALAERHHNNGLVSLDPNMIEDRDAWDWFHNRWLAHTHVYRVSDEDAEWIWPKRPPESWSQELLTTPESPVQVVLLTEGPKGAKVFLPKEEVKIPGINVKVRDTVGAGDTFIGATLANLWQRGATTAQALKELTPQAWQEIAAQAVAAAAITCQRPGANPPTKPDLN